MFLFVSLGSLLISSRLLYYQFHGFNSLSHSTVKLYFDGINVELQVLSEANKL
jgi:hypothetical protein